MAERENPPTTSVLKELPQKILDALEDGIYLIDRDYRVVYANPVMVQQFGDPRPGIRCYEYTEGISEVCGSCPMQFILSGMRYRQQWQSRRTGRHYERISIPLYFSKGEILQLGIFHDVTDFKESEEAVIRAISHEKSRIGRDLHDGLLQHLSGQLYLFQALAASLKPEGPEQKEQVQRLEDLMRQAIHQARALARGLCPVGLETDGFPAALRKLLDGVDKLYGLRVELKTRGVPEEEAKWPWLGDERESHLYRILQEGINNAIKHGAARNIQVLLEEQNNGLTLEVCNDGAPLPADYEQNLGMGLRSVAFRMKILGGNWSLTSQPGQTCLRCRVNNLEEKRKAVS